MGKKIWFLALVVSLGMALFLIAQEKKEEGSSKEISVELEAKIEQLIEQLGADDWQTREAATNALEEIGEPAEPFLKKVIQNPDAEVRIRAKGLIRKIEAKRYGKIAFVKERSIWIMDFDGENQIQLTTKGISAYSPRWSPDGKRIAFIGTIRRSHAIYVMDADGEHQTKLTNDHPFISYLCWSPDSKKIALESYKGGGNTDIFVIDTVSKDEINLTNNEAWNCEPCWSPDSKKIAFWSDRGDGNWEIYVMDANGKNPTRLTNNKAWDRAPRWSPDGRKIAFHSERDGNTEIYLMDADGKNQTRLTNTKICEFFPRWSPDGKKIVFVSDLNKNKYEEIVGLIRDEPPRSTVIQIGQPPPAPSNLEIYLMDADGKNQTRLTNDMALNQSPCWSPDGKKIVIVSNRDGQPEIYVMDVGGKNQTRLTHGGGTMPAWQPVPKK